MNAAKHVSCGTDVTMKRAKATSDQVPLLEIWCPVCLTVVPPSDLDVPGPLVVLLE